ncbi:MAG: putative Tyrosine-protein kinase, partial [Streblomastix strix]
METTACAGTSGERSISRMEVIRKSQDPQSTEKKQVNKELQQGIIKEVPEKEVAFFNPCFLRPKKNSTELRKIMDCTVIDQQLQDISFKMEDLQTIKQLLQPGDYAVTIDIKSAYSHIHVDQDLSPYLSFSFNNRCYSYVAMPFGIKSAPRTFTKMLRPVI